MVALPGKGHIFLFHYVIANLFYSLILDSLSGTLHSSKHYTRELGDE
jgi:hypothetical protein